MKASQLFVPILLAALVIVVMISTAIEQSSDKRTHELLERLTEQLSERSTVVVEAPQPRPAPRPQVELAPPKVETQVAVEPEPDPETEREAEPEPEQEVEAEPTPGTSADLSRLDWPTYGPTIESVIRDLLAGEYQQVYDRFTDEYKQALPVDMIAAAMDPIRKKHGAFQSIVEHAAPTRRLPPGLHGFMVTTETQSAGPLVFTITLNEQQRVASLYVR